MHSSAMQFEFMVPWIEAWGIGYHVGLDGISAALHHDHVPDSDFHSCVMARQKHVKYYMMSMLALSTGMLGVFIALDFFMFYVFWEFQLVDVSHHRRVGRTSQTLRCGQVLPLHRCRLLLMLVAIIWIYLDIHQQTGQFTTDLMFITKHLDVGLEVQQWLFLAFFLAFAIKVPMFPFHTWLPDAHVEAPTAGSVILAGVLLKMGTYGFLRFNLPLFPAASHELFPYVGWLAVIGIVYGALVAMVQEDLKNWLPTRVSAISGSSCSVFSLSTIKGCLELYYRILTTVSAQAPSS